MSIVAPFLEWWWYDSESKPKKTPYSIDAHLSFFVDELRHEDVLAEQVPPAPRTLVFPLAEKWLILTFGEQMSLCKNHQMVSLL
jgi:hypothetical protein